MFVKLNFFDPRKERKESVFMQSTDELCVKSRKNIGYKFFFQVELEKDGWE